MVRTAKIGRMMASALRRVGAFFINIIVAFYGGGHGKIRVMFESLIGLVAAAEISKAQMEVQTTADAYYVAVQEYTAAKARETAVKYTVTYDISYRGTILSDKDDFARKVESILLDERGWKRAGVAFRKVESGGRMHVILAEGAQVEAASPTVCSPKLSCSVGNLVLINDDRWRGGSDSYNELGVSIERYQEMVLNHEVGHFLGHRHIESCETEAGQAPVMLQQSTGLRGCQPNSWPLPSELWVSGL